LTTQIKLQASHKHSKIVHVLNEYLFIVIKKYTSYNTDTFVPILIPMMRVIIFSLFIVGFQAFAQPGQNFDPATMAQREKQMMLDSIKGLSMDQVALFDVVYDSYATSIKNMRSGDQPVDREIMIQKMAAIREEKNTMMKDVLSTEQYDRYIQILANIRKNWAQRPN